MSNAVRRFGRAAVLAGLLALVAMLALLTVSRAFGYRMLIVRSGSMTGTADTGSLVVARPIAAADVAVGDVILIQRKGADDILLAPVLHRVIQRHVDDDGLLVVQTKGDANPDPDPSPFALQGPTVTPVVIIPLVGFALARIQTPIGVLALVIFPLVLFTAFTLLRLWTTKEQSLAISPLSPSQPRSFRCW
jgi:signal peptidase